MIDYTTVPTDQLSYALSYTRNQRRRERILDVLRDRALIEFVDEMHGEAIMDLRVDEWLDACAAVDESDPRAQTGSFTLLRQLTCDELHRRALMENAERTGSCT